MNDDFVPDQPDPTLQADHSDFVPDQPDLSGMKAHVAQNFSDHQKAQAETATAEGPKGIPKEVHPAKSFIEALEAGWQTSVSGLIKAGHAPDTVLPEDAGRAFRIASQIGQLAGDAPAMVAGMITGGTAGATAGTATFPVVGTISGATVGAAAGAFAVPAAMRKMLIDHYEKGDITTAGDFAERAMATSWEAIKGGVTGAATAIAGTATAAYGVAAAGVAELATMTTVAKGLEGHLPNADDFIDSAIVLGGLHSIGALASKLRSVYADTGEKPAELVQRAQTDPTVKQDLLSENVGPKPEVPSETLKTEDHPAFQNHETADEELTPPSKVSIPETETEEKALPKGEGEDLNAAREKIRSRIGEQEQSDGSLKEWAGEKWNDFYKNYFDSLDPIKNAVEDKNLPADKDPYVLGRTFAAYMDKTRLFFEDGTLDFKSKETNGEGLQSIMDSLPGKDMDRFRDYWVSRRALELNDRGIETGMDMDAAKKIVDSDSETYQPYVDRIVAYKNRVLKYFADSGHLSKDLYNKLVEDNKNHASFYRIMEPDDLTGRTPGQGKPIKAIKGSERQIVDPIFSTFKDTELLIKMAEQNRVKTAAVDALKGSDILRPDEKQMKPVTVSGDEVERELSKQGIDVSAEAITVFRKSDRPLADNQIEIFKDGKRLVFDTTPEIAESLNGLGQNPGADSLFIKAMRPFAATARIMTTGNPAFALRHVFRAQFFAAAYSESGQMPFIDALKTISKTPEDMELMKQWLADGGAQGSLEKLDKDYFENKLTSLDKEAPFISRAWNYVKNKAEMSEVFIRTADNANRFAEYKKAMKGKENPTMSDRMQAAIASRDVGIDYSRSGAKMAAIAQISAFFNAKVQGMDLAARRAYADPVGFSLRTAKWVTVPSLLVWASGHDDIRYQQTPDWEKDLFWVIPVDHWRQATDEEASGYHEQLKRPAPNGGWEVNDGPTFRLPKPPGIGQIFGSAPEAILNSYFGKDPEAMKSLARSIMAEAGTIPIPNAIAPVLEQMTNHSFFTGNPIIPASREKLAPELQYTEYTSDTAKALGKMIAAVPGLRSIGPGNNTLASPMVIENYSDAWGGSMGKYALALADKGLQVAGVVPDIKPAKYISEMPFAKEFMVRFPMAKAQSIETFESRMKEYETKAASTKFLAKQGDVTGAMNYMDSHGPQGIVMGLQKQNQVLHMISQNPQISKVQKRQLMDGIYNQMIQMSELGNKTLDQMEH